MRHTFLSLILTLATLTAMARPAHAGETLKVLVPDRGNLQYMSFWLAKGAGYFAAAGIDVELVVPPGPQQTQVWFEERKADVAVLPPPVYANLVAGGVPVVLVANLLSNDPIELVVRRSVLTERKLSADQPLRVRLEGLRGIRLGIAPHPPTRLRALFASVGLDADKDTTMVILHGKEQNAAFHDGKVDALYAHTPFLEHAIVHDDAVVLVDQARGEVPALANRQIHALGVRRSLLETRPALVTALVDAIGRAQALVHRSQPEAVETLAREMKERDRRELETIVRLYEPAVPREPTFRAEDIPSVLSLFPAGMPKPDLSNVDLAKHVLPPAKAAEPDHRGLVWGLAVAVVLAAIVAVVVVRGRRPCT